MRTLIILTLIAVTATAQKPAELDATPQPDINAALTAISTANLEGHVRRLAGFGTRHTFSDTESETRGIGAARRWIRQRFEECAKVSKGRMKVALEEFPVTTSRRMRLPEDAKVINVVATLEGTEKDRFVIVSGHYDSRASRGSDAESDAPGADDDASGVAVVLELARVMAEMKPRCTVLFIAFDGEEHGLWGASAHASRARELKQRVTAMMTNDIVGGVRGTSGLREPDRLRLFSEGVPSGPRTQGGRPRRNVVGSDNDAPSRQLARYLRRRALTYVPGFEVTLIFRQDRYMRGGDHKAFNRAGFPGVRFTEPHENYDWQHQDVRKKEDGTLYGDLPENLDYEFVRKVAQVNAAGLMELAMAPPAPRQVRMLTRRLTPHTDLRWQKVETEDVAGYSVLYRRTHEPFWTHRVTVGKDADGVHLKQLSKDDWLFAVQSVDTAGRRSLPVYPRPSRR